MSRKKLVLAVAGFLIFFVFLLKEIINPNESRHWHVIGLYLYVGGIVVMCLYFIIAYRSEDRK